MVVLVHLPQDTERTIIPYLNKKETLEGLLNDGYRTWEKYKKWKKKIKRPSSTRRFGRSTKKKKLKI